MQHFFRLFSLVSVVVKRTLAQPWLALAALLGLVLASALAMSIPLYADATYHRIFRENLTEENAINQSDRPPVVTLFHFPTGNTGPAEWQELEGLDNYLTSRGHASTIGLNATENIRYYRTAEYPLFPLDASTFASANALLTVRVGTMSNLEDHITLLEGALPVPSESSSAPIDVLVSDRLAQVVGFQLGEVYIISAPGASTEQVSIPIRIAGVWIPTNPAEKYWFTPMNSIQESFFITQEDYQNHLAPALEDEIALAFWYTIFDDSTITYEDARPLIVRIHAVERRTLALKEGVRLSDSPIEAMQRYQRDARLLTLMLHIVSIPIVGLLLTFISLVARLVIEGRRNEIAVLRSRGASSAQIIGLSTLEALLTGLVGLAVSLPVGIGLAAIMGKTESFLNFSLSVQDLRVRLTGSALIFGIAAVIISALAQLWPTMGAARHTILTYKRESARLQRTPLWQRAWLDVILLLVSIYGYSLLRRQGSITTDAATSQLQDPLLYLLPVLLILALTLLCLRIMPYVMSALAWLLEHTRSVSLLMAVRHIARTPGSYSIPLTLLILTLSLSIFTASMAGSLDTHLRDQTYYQAGADVVFLERGENASLLSAFAQRPAATDEETAGSSWVFLPVSDYLDQPGVLAVTRVGIYPAIASIGTRQSIGKFYGVDRLSFSQVSYWRSDFAAVSLGALMNQIAIYPDGVLAPASFLRQYGLGIGDLLTLTVDTYGDSHDLDVRIAGSFDLFPGWYPEESTLFVGNLDHLFEQGGGEYPYRVWVKTQPGVDPVSISDTLAPLTIGRSIPDIEIAAAQTSPRRQGMFGILSVGYSAAVVLTVIGFLMYALFSFRQRFVELGMLRAIGLSTRQMTALLAWELALLIVIGSAIGTVLGIQISLLFVPFMKVSGADILNIPPYQVQIAWSSILRIYGVFGLLFALELGLLVVLLRRMKISQAIKLGETV